MARQSGLTGAIDIAGFGTMHLKQWTVTWAQAAVDVTAFTDSSKATVPGIREWRGTARGSLDSATAPSMPSATAAGTFTSFTSKTWTGNCVVTEITPDVSVDGEATVSIAFVGDGDFSPY